MAGLLDDMNSLVSGLGPSEDEKRQARAQAALMAGLGMLGARPRYLAQDLSRAAMGGIVDYNQQMRDSGEDKMKRIAVAQQMQQMLAQRQQAQSAQELQQRIGGAFTGTGPNLAAMGPGGPTQANAAATAPVPMAEQYMKAAALAAQSGRPDLAEKYAKLAEAGREEYSTTPQVVRDEATGKLRLAQFGKYGGKKTADGLSPAEKLHFADAGGVAGVGMNPYTGKVESQGMPKTMTPGELDTSKRGWANYGLSKNADARAAEAAKGGGSGKPQWDAGSGSFVYAPTPENPTGRIVAPEGYQKIDKPLTESQGKNSMYLGMMKSATENIDKLSGLNNAEIALARGDARYVPQFMQNLAAPEKAQKYIQSSLQWTEAMLRITTGATAPPEEIVRTSRTFFPQVGDGAEVIAQKAEQRKRVEKLVAIASGKGAQQVENVLGNAGDGWSVTEIK